MASLRNVTFGSHKAPSDFEVQSILSKETRDRVSELNEMLIDTVFSLTANIIQTRNRAFRILESTFLVSDDSLKKSLQKSLEVFNEHTDAFAEDLQANSQKKNLSLFRFRELLNNQFILISDFFSRYLSSPFVPPVFTLVGNERILSYASSCLTDVHAILTINSESIEEAIKKIMSANFALLSVCENSSFSFKEHRLSMKRSLSMPLFFQGCVPHPMTTFTPPLVTCELRDES